MSDDLLDKTDNTKKTAKAVPPAKKAPEFFNSNVFGEDYEIEKEEVIEEAPPPPVFSEEELEAAKRMAFDQGKAEGVRESTESREQFTASLLQDLTQSAHTLIAAEDAREKRFECESVNLSLQIFEQLFPHYCEDRGFEELRAALLKVIQGEEGVSQILVEVHPDYVDDIDQFIKDSATQLPRECCYEVIGTATFSSSQFKLSWKDGGAVHDIDSIASKIRDILHDVLDQEAVKPHDGLEAPDVDTVPEAEPIVSETADSTISDEAPIAPPDEDPKPEDEQSGDILDE